MKQKFNIIESTCVPLPLENVDTDQIIPARYLKETTREEKFFGAHLFPGVSRRTASRIPPLS